MEKRCPACDLPLSHPVASVAVSSNDGMVHGVMGLCERCIVQNRSLPAAIRFKRISRAGDRALVRPDRYLCAIFPNIGAARLAAGMLGHPEHALQTLNALGWGNDTSHPD